MSSDDLTQKIDNEVGKPTQPSITAVFELLRDLKSELTSVNARFDQIDARFDQIDARLDRSDARIDSLSARLDQVEIRLARDIEAVNIRVTEGFRELSNKIDALNRSRLQTEADYIGLLQRVTDLESKAS